MKCVRCDAVIDLTKATCPACGVALDADGDGVPDVLDRLIEKKARAMIEAEKREARAGEEMRASKARAEEAAKERKEDEASLERSKRLLEWAEERRAGVWYMPGWAAGIALAVALIVGGVIMPSCVEPIAERSVFVGNLVCPSVCPSCRGPGRIFTWHESSGSSEGNVSVQLCHNADVDIDRMEWMQVSNEEEGRLAPYVLTLWANAGLDMLAVALVLLLVGPFVLARWHASSIREDRARLRERIADLEHKLGPPTKPDTPGYRE